MAATLQFDPNQYNERTLKLIMRKTQEWQCTPGEAVAKLLDLIAKRQRAKA